jgi:hypothetical protein
MCHTVLYTVNMSKMIQVRNVPEQVHSTLKERPSMREWLERTRQARPIPTRRTAAQVLRELRDAR